MIRTSQLAKTYDGAPALEGVTLEVARGGGLGLIGAKGSGKTTLLRILATLVPPTSGTVSIDGLDAVADVYRVRPRIAYVGRERLVGHGLRAGEYLQFVASARRPATGGAGMAVDNALARAALDRTAMVDALSDGLRQRLALAAALMVAPVVLLLDDPLRALDETSRASFTGWICEARDRGAAVVVAANTASDLALLCQRAARLEAGRVVSMSAVDRAATLGMPGDAAGAVET